MRAPKLRVWTASSLVAGLSKHVIEVLAGIEGDRKFALEQRRSYDSEKYIYAADRVLDAAVGHIEGAVPATDNQTLAILAEALRTETTGGGHFGI